MSQRCSLTDDELSQAEFLGATFKALKNTATAVLEKQKQEREAANALMELAENSKAGADDDELQAILREAEEAVALAGSLEEAESNTSNDSDAGKSDGGD